MKESIEYKILNEKILNMEKIVFGNSNTLGLINSLEKTFKSYETEIENCKDKVIHCDEEAKKDLREMKDRLEILENWIFGITISEGLITKVKKMEQKLVDKILK